MARSRAAGRLFGAARGRAGVLAPRAGARAPRLGLHSRPADANAGRQEALPGMSDHLEDTRVITEDAPQYNATLVRREDHLAELASFWVKLDGDPVPFEAGQYMTAGLGRDLSLIH